MAIYSAASDLRLDPGFPFVETWKPGDRPMLAGIYRCGCAGEIALPYGANLPGPEGHACGLDRGAIRWRLCVAVEDANATVVRFPRAAKPVRRADRASDLSA